MHTGVVFSLEELLLGYVEVPSLGGVCGKAMDKVSLIGTEVTVYCPCGKLYMVQSLVSPPAPTNKGFGLVPASIAKVPARSISFAVATILTGGVRTLSMMLITPPVKRMF